MVVAPRVLRQTFPGDHPVQWRTASPLWAVLQPRTDNPVFAQPAMLRFTTDTFMEDFLTVATETPTRLWEWQVQKETWRKPAPIPSLRLAPGQTPSTPPTQMLDDPALQNEPLKLYQPAHQRYYLVAANLVCRIPGLPDKTLKTTQRETVSFVVRRLLTVNKVLQEHAFVNGFWQPVEPALLQSLKAGEQTFPMFPVTYTQRADGYARRMFSGLIPVSNREAFLNAGLQSKATGDSVVETEGDRRDRLLTLLQVDVVAPWRNINQSRIQEDRTLVESWSKLEAGRRNELLASVHLAQDKLQSVSWYVLLDLAYYLRDYLPAVWNRLEISPDTPVPTGTPGKALLDTLQSTTFKLETSENFNTFMVLQNKFSGVSDPTGRTSLAKALKDVYAARVHLENATAPYSYQSPAGWPASQFLLCGNGVNSLVNGGDLDLLVFVQRIRDALTALPPDANQRLPLVPTAPTLIKSQNEANYDNDLFLIRCVYERPNCPPSVHPTVVSEPTQRFQMASYFDPDAPARPIRIPMPIDTSPAGLRKFAKNTMFVMSDSLACQVEKARDLTFGDLVLSVLPWPFHKDFSASAGGCPSGTLSFGKICTFSIPIITICALILLIIIVSLLDLIFKWVPFLIFCLPLPGLKAKK
ncbi:hypothetical protein JOY44_01990 [Phormidium sp. CLA17]|uniref:hypothetical protein n=1 Tax=Leptolyngbya sp. Cla-17 TaxID=2803751 RepID=UPI0017A0E968|nr:hypothetical protein [Leptolyngbya sp. Cla-17]MBM0740398.1 hypothetical protein [Leptolyngbya sp. Cla-17]